MLKVGLCVRQRREKDWPRKGTYQPVYIPHICIIFFFKRIIIYDKIRCLR
jgi:hypothetical protein